MRMKMKMRRKIEIEIKIEGPDGCVCVSELAAE